jgi:hypothetical protein
MLRCVLRYDEALTHFDNALVREPSNLEALYNRGNLLLDMKKPEAALTSFDQYLNIRKNNPDVFYSKASALSTLEFYEESLKYYDQAIKLNNNIAKYHFGRGNLLRELQCYDQAIESYNYAISINKDYAAAHNNKAMALLSMNNFEEGWKLYEWRAKLEKINLHPIKIAKNWDGEKVIGSLLVLSEQGLGDEIFYSGMLNDLHAMVDKITVCVDSRLVCLYKRSFESIEFISKESFVTSKSYHSQIYMASLGGYFRASQQALLTNVRTPYLKACPEKTENYRARLSGEKKLICGLSWISKNADFGIAKTLRLNNLRSILTLPDIDFVDLQYGDTSEEQAAFYDEAGIKLKKIPDVDNFQDIDGLAALINACDVVLTISNITAHLAGALGKTAIVMLPYARVFLWYWHNGNDRSLWYPDVRLVRQAKNGDWDSVMDRVKLILAEIDDCQIRRFNRSK